MKKIIFIILGVAVLLLAIAGVSSYNSFVKLNEQVEGKWSQVTADYQRRFDLIPNLVSTVQGIAKQEQAVFIGVAEARTKVGQLTVDSSVLSDPQSFAKFNAAQGELSSALSRLLLVQENYPVLRSAENFLSLQNQLEGTENRIAVARKDFNAVVQDYNTKIKSFPSVIFAKMFGFEAKNYFELQSESASQAPAVQF